MWRKIQFPKCITSAFAGSRGFSSVNSMKSSGHIYTAKRGVTENQSSDLNGEMSNFKQHEENSRGHENNYNEFRTSSMFALMPLMFFLANPLDTLKCIFSDKNEFSRNKLLNRIVVAQYEANNPMEDRYVVGQLKTLDGFVMAVFDGHGGWQMAEYAKNNLMEFMEASLRENKGKQYNNEDEYIKASIIETFQKIEENFLELAKIAYEHGFNQTARVGSCAIVSLVHDNKLYVANLGDCSGVLLKSNEGDSALTPIKISQKFNASSKKEQKRLRELFKNDNDIVVCRPNNPKACYVKVRETSVYGRKKQPVIVEHAATDSSVWGLQINSDISLNSHVPNFAGPYISSHPDIKTFDLDKSTRYLLLACDGLWDELTRQDVAKVVQNHSKKDKNQLAQAILDETLNQAAKSHKMSVEDLKNLPKAVKRKFHDDITFVLADLKGQGSN